MGIRPPAVTDPSGAEVEGEVAADPGVPGEDAAEVAVGRPVVRRDRQGQRAADPDSEHERDLRDVEHEHGGHGQPPGSGEVQGAFTADGKPAALRKGAGCAAEQENREEERTRLLHHASIYTTRRTKRVRIRCPEFNGMGPSSDNSSEERPMDWKKRFKRDEDELRDLVEKLVEAPALSSLTAVDREAVFRLISRKIVEMRAVADDCLGGRSDDEKSALEYKLRVEFPLFAHLSSLSFLPREYVEWSCATRNQSLTPDPAGSKTSAIMSQLTATRTLLSGNEAIARGAWEAGVTIATGYPGTPSTEILEAARAYKDDIYCEWSPNEKVALEVAAGASLAGARAIVTMKHVGLNVAADPLMTLSYIGTVGGPGDLRCRRPGHALLPERAGHAALRPVCKDSHPRAVRLPGGKGLSRTGAGDFREAFHAGHPSLHHPRQPLQRRRHPRPADGHARPARASRRIPSGSSPSRCMRAPCGCASRSGHAALAAEANTSAANSIEWGDRGLGIIAEGIAYQYVRELAPMHPC